MDNKMQLTPDDESKKHDQPPWPLRHGYTLAAILFTVLFLVLFVATEYGRQYGFTRETAEPSFRSALGSSAITLASLGVCGILSLILGNGVASLFLRHKLKKAVPYRTFMEWVGSSNEKKIVDLIRLHELHVFAAEPKLREEAVNIPCRMVPFYMLPIRDKVFRRALSPFKEIYFDMDELEYLFDENLDVLRRARPDKLKGEGSLAKETEANLEITLRKAESRKGDKGRLENMQQVNDCYKLQAYVITKLVQLSYEKWEKQKSKEKPVTHKKIQIMVRHVLAKHPELQKRILELRGKRNPDLPEAMKDFFRHAMPDEMVDWRGGKPTLEDLIIKYTKGSREESREDGFLINGLK